MYVTDVVQPKDSSRWKSINTYTHTHTHTHTHTQSAKNISNCFLKGLLIAYSLFVVMEEFRFVTLFYYKNCIDKIIISYLSVQKQTDG